MFNPDLQITLAVQTFHPPWFDLLMGFVSWPGNPPHLLLITTISVLILLFRRNNLEAIFLSLNAAVAFFLTSSLKLLINRPRPSSDLIHVFRHLNDASFPSGHVLQYTAIFGFLVYLIYIHFPKSRKKTACLVFLIFWISLVGLSRIYLGEHYFTDVLGGYLVGALILIFTIKIYQKARSNDKI